MKDCTRLDVVTANMSYNSKKIVSTNKERNNGQEYWNKLKTQMKNDSWSVLNSSLSLSENKEDCSIDISITYEKKLQKYIKNIDFNYSKNEEKTPSEITPTLIKQLNNFASLASSLAQKLSNSDEIVQSENSQNDE